MYSSYSICSLITGVSDTSVFSSNVCSLVFSASVLSAAGSATELSVSLFTITETAPDKSPFETIIVDEPVCFAVTTPLPDTAATDVLVDLYETVCSASAGNTDTLSLNAVPGFITRYSLFIFIPVVFTFTVRLTSFITLPADTYMVTYPFEIPFTSPAEVTVAIFISDERKVIVLSVAFAGSAVAVRFIVFPTSTS